MSTAQSIGQATELTSRRELGGPRHDAGSTTNRSPLVGIVILNWNRPEHITACLRSVGCLDYPAFQTIVVDNGSTDGSPSIIRQQFPDVSLIENGRNLGFAAGNNVGISYLLGRGVDYVLLLNDDAEIAPDALHWLVRAGDSDPTIGVLGPTIYYYHPNNVIWSAGGMVDKLGTAHHRSVDAVAQESDAVVEAARDVDYVTGCALLIKRQVIEAVGMLDERFFAYYEETEWCARARRAGFRVAYVPPARVWHKISQTERSHSCDYLYLMTRNRLLYLRCTGASPWLILLAVLDVLRTVGSWLIRPRYRRNRPLSLALLRGVKDFAIGRFGEPSSFHPRHRSGRPAG
jgi:GT2 family glycosyltransferase